MPESDASSRPALFSPRLCGEPVEKRHAAAMARVLDDARIYTFLPDDPPSLEHLQRMYEFLSGGKSPDGSERWLTWILVPRGAAVDPIGFVQATIKEPESVHVAYLLNPAHWRRGYAREAVIALLDVVFEQYRVGRAIAETDTRNVGSIALLRSLGFCHVRTVPDAAVFKGASSHEHVFELTPADWAGVRQARHR